MTDETTAPRPEGLFELTLDDAFRELTDCLVAGLVVYQEPHNRWVNRAAARLTGYDREALLAMNFWDIVDEEFRDVVRRQGAARLAGEPTPQRYEVRLRRADGTSHWVDFAASNVLLEGRQAVLGVVTDIDHRKSAEAAARESEARYRFLSDAALEGVAITDRGQILDISAPLARMLGYQVDEMLGRSVTIFVPPPLRTEVTARLHDTFERAYESEALRKDGTTFPIEAVARLIPWQGRQVRVTVIRDLTERHRMERERREMEQQLQRGQRLESLGLLAGGIAHDFNNLLALIISYTELSLDTLGDAGQVSEDLAEVLNAAHTAAALTRQLLVFSRRDLTEPEVLDVNAVVRDLERMLVRTITHNVVLETELTPGAWPIQIGMPQMEQLLVNLAINARDAMPAGGTLTIATGNETLSEPTVGVDGPIPAGQWLKLTVADTGSGMSVDVAARAFEPFFSTKEAARGTGLGLSIVYGIVKAAGGHIQIDTAAGAGTRFMVRLPRADAKPALQPEAPEGADASAGRVLVVEDQVEVLRVVARMLTRSGFEVVTAPCAEDALVVMAAEGDRIDLLLTDVIMPGRSGLELAREVRLQRPTLPVLYMSGYPDEVVREQGHALDAPLVPKPFRAEDLLRHVRSALGHG